MKKKRSKAEATRQLHRNPNEEKAKLQREGRGARDEEEVCGIIYYAFASVFLPIGGIFMYFAFSDVNRGDVNRIASLVFGTLLVHQERFVPFTSLACLRALLY